MSKKIKILSLALAVVMALGVFTLSVGAADAAGGDFTPVFRFVAASDSHVRRSDNVTHDRIGKMMDMVYGEAAADPSYNAVDALAIVGDLTNDGYRDEFDKFSDAVFGALRGDTRFIGVVAKNHDGYNLPRAEMRAYYNTVTGNDADFHVVIGGYHFIGVSASEDGGVYYDLGQIKWVDDQIKAAVAEAPDRPVFVMHHEHVAGTVFGSDPVVGWGVPHFAQILRKYPQVFDISGHSHYPLNDPRSIWQGDFTAIGTGAIYYMELDVDETRDYCPPDGYQTSTCWIIELDADNNMRLRGMDIEAGAQLCEYYLANPADPANRDYKPSHREKQSSAPVFAAGSEIAVESGYGKMTLTVPLAESTDGMAVTLYRAQAKSSSGLLTTSWTLPVYYRISDQSEIELELSELAAGTYTVKVFAETAYGVKSAPLTAKVTVDGDNTFVNFFHRLARWFADFFEVVKSWF